MSTNFNARSPAFPAQELDAQGAPRAGMEFGLTKREWIAATLLAGLLAEGGEAANGYEHTFAAKAVAHADALLSVLEM